MTSLQFQASINEEINQSKQQIVNKFTVFKQKLPELQRIKNTNQESKLLVPQMITSLNSLNSHNGQIFRKIQSNLLAELNADVQTQDNTNTSQQTQAYQVQINQQDSVQAQQITREIQELVQIVSEMTGKVYETGSIINRIDQNIMETDTLVDVGVENLVIARKHQKTVNKLRSVTYMFFLIDFIMAIVYGIIR